LDFKTEKEISSFYSDLDISFGTISARSFFRASFSSSEQLFRLDREEWETVKETLAFPHFEGIEILKVPVESIDSEFRRLEMPRTSDEEASQASEKQSLPEVAEVRIQVELDGQQLARFLQTQQLLIAGEIDKLNKGVLPAGKLTELLVTCKATFELADCILQHSFLSSIILFAVPRSSDTQPLRLSLSIHQVIETGLNLAVLGEAGAGKTTCLQMHAAKLLAREDDSQLVLYLPLARVTYCYRRSPDSAFDWHPVSHLLRAILTFFQVEEGDLPEVELRNALRDRETLLLLDGIDEVIGSAPWILDAISIFSKSYPRAQLIVSARMGGEYISRIGLLKLTLLPFTDAQREHFITHWFADHKDRRVSQILRHLKTESELSEVLRRPLLATIMCVLAESDVPLPKTEIRLYQERIRLLLGDYDIHKSAYRLTSQRHHLELAARRIGFALHNQAIREADLGSLVRVAQECAGTRAEREGMRRAVHELISPCNILVPMSVNGSVGFGHLRYQEYLAAVELNQNRSIEVGPLVYDPWWRGSLVFFAQLVEDIEFLVRWVIDNGDVSSARETLDVMMRVSSSRNKGDLMREIQRRVDLENFVSTISSDEDEIFIDLSESGAA
jgi:hypothetical protein